MEITARLTADAKINTLKDERQVVNFNVALNDSYKIKESSEIKKVTTFFQSSYWINPAIAKHLTKGTLVELSGRLSVSSYKDTQGEPKARLNFHVNNLKLHGRSNATTNQTKKVEPVAQVQTNEITDDLPF
jgi:single-strand DNA-binding protein